MGKDIITYQKRLELIDECLRKFEKPKNIKEIAKYCNDRLPHPFDERMYRYDIKKIAESYDVDILETVINGYKCYTYRDESFSIKDDLGNDIGDDFVVELYENGQDSIGELSVIFRTQSAALISDMTDFFRLWHSIEQKYLPHYGVENIDYALYYNKFCRSIVVPNKNSSTEELAQAISGYIELFDKLMKGFLAGRYSPADIEHCYAEYIARQSIII